MKNLKILIFLVALISQSLIIAQQTPAPKQTKDFAIVGATAHIGNGTVIEKSLIIVKNGKAAYRNRCISRKFGCNGNAGY